MNTLHVTNGDSVIYLWKKAGLLGTHLSWRDVLHEGPVLNDLPLEAMSTKTHHDFERRDATIYCAARKR
ncbi:MAG: hypothetical protein ACXWNK_09285 [Vulcanimicrobiaceae bacterium]